MSRSKFDQMLITHKRKEQLNEPRIIVPVHRYGHNVVIRYTYKDRVIPYLGTHEIMSGGIYIDSSGGWSTAKYSFAKFETRLYPPHTLLGMDLTPSDTGTRVERTFITIDFQPGNVSAFEWINFALANFLIQAREEWYAPDQPKQNSLPF